MVSTAERSVSNHYPYAFPKLGITPRERVINPEATDEERRARALRPTARLLAHSLARATKMDRSWEKSVAKGIPNGSLHHLVDCVVQLKPAVCESPVRLPEIERSLGRARAMETALQALHLLLLIRLGIPSRQSVKRVAREKPELGKRNYTRILDNLSRNGDETKRTLYEEWKAEIDAKAKETHELVTSFRTRLNQFKNMKGGE